MRYLPFLMVLGSPLFAQQEPPTLHITSPTTWDADWTGEQDRIYFAQWSPDLVNWVYLPTMKHGASIHGIGADLSGTKGFLRLHYYDDPTISDLDAAKAADHDNDALSNWEEVNIHGTDPTNPDTDDDTLPDGWETAHQLDPLDNGTTNPQHGADGNFQNSGTSNSQAFSSGVQAITGATLADHDADGLPNEIDAASEEPLIDWEKALEAGYVVIDLKTSALPFPAFRHLDMILNNHGDIARGVSNDGEHPPSLWGAETNYVWRDFQEFPPGPGHHFVDYSESMLSFGDDGKVYDRVWLSDQPLYYDMLVWQNPDSPPVLQGNIVPTGSNESSLITIARFDKIVTQHDFVDDEESNPMRIRTITVNGTTSTETDDAYPAVEKLSSIAHTNGNTLVPAVLRSGRIPITKEGVTKVGDILITGYPLFYNEDPMGRLLLTQGTSSEETYLERRLIDRSESMPMPAISDMNRSGVGITFPLKQLWRNGRTIQLDELLAGSGWENIQAEQINESGDILGSASRIGGNGDIVPVLLQTVLVKDNIYPTGVDDLSRTADKSDIGYWNDFWIMAPLQGPPLPGGDAYENLTKIRIPGRAGANGIVSSANATPDPAQIALDGAFHDVLWQGTGGGKFSEERVKLDIAGDPETKEMPIMVKTMKYRTVKVAVYRVKRPGPRDFPAFTAQQKENIDRQLFKAYSRQINAWFSLDYFDKEIAYDTHGDPADPSDTRPDGALIIETAEEMAFATSPEFSGTDDTHDIKIILVDDIRYSVENFHAAGKSYKGVKGRWIFPHNTCILAYGIRLENPAGDPDVISQETSTQLGDTMAHEIGHVMLKKGHPDLYDKLDPINSGGPAPLPSLGLPKQKERLMCSGNHRDAGSFRLVKTEWDKAEIWLSDNID